MKKIDQTLLDSIKKAVKDGDTSDDSIIELTEVVHENDTEMSDEQKNNQAKLLKDINNSIEQIEDKKLNKKIAKKIINQNYSNTIQNDDLVKKNNKNNKLREIIQNAQIINKEKKVDKDTENPRIKSFMNTIISESINDKLHDILYTKSNTELNDNIKEMITEIIQKELVNWINNNMESVAKKILQQTIDESIED